MTLYGKLSSRIVSEKVLQNLVLHGSPISNYYNKVKMVLHLKNITFQEKKAAPSQTEEFLKISPMGLIPVLEVGGTYIAESQVIIEFLEEAYPQTKSVLGNDIFERAKVRQCNTFIDLYIDAPARKIFNLRRDNQSHLINNDMLNAAVLEVRKGVKALLRASTFSPYICSSELTLADISAAATLLPFGEFIEKNFPENPLAEIPGFEKYTDLLMQNPFIRKIEEDRIKMNKILQRARAIEKSRNQTVS